MKNLMSRDEYLQKANEGFIKDTLKKGWDKLKSIFSLGMKKVKGFLAIFDSSGKVLPIVSPCAVIDKFSDSDAVEVYAPKELSDLTIQAGGRGCKQVAPNDTKTGYYEDAPQGSREYNNFLSISQLLNGSVTESWQDVTDNRNTYTTDDEGFSDYLPRLTMKKFEEKLNKMINKRISTNGQDIKYGKATIGLEDNLLIFGCPGIGKSTVPDMVIRKYNESISKSGGDPSQMISMIKINCANLHPGDLLMPTPPKAVDIIGAIEDDREAFPTAAKYLDSLSDEENKELKKKVANSVQFATSDVPKSWLPSYLPIGGDFDEIQNDRANSGIFTDKDGNTKRVGNGGIIFLDELLRAEEDVFKELMTFLFERKIAGWQLGSKWSVIAASNRPCDGEDVRKVWENWKKEPAKGSRFSRRFLLLPDPESWKNYERSRWDESKLGKIDILFDFIFDPNSVKHVGENDEEWPRWISQLNPDKESVSLAQTSIEPRNWTKTFDDIKEYMMDNNIDNILKIEPYELEEALNDAGGINKDLLNELVKWWGKHKNKFDLDMIMEDPTFYKYNDSKDGEEGENDSTNDVVEVNELMDSIITALEDRYKEDPSKLTDDMMANIVAWIGINFPNNIEPLSRFMTKLVGNKNALWNGIYGVNSLKTQYTLRAAYPEKGLEEEVEKREHLTLEDGKLSDHCWPEGSLEEIKKLMKKYFPWRIKGGKILYYDELEAPDIKKEGEDE